MYPKIINVKAVDNYFLVVSFENQITKKYNCCNLLKKPQFYQLNDILLFKNVKVDSGGYGIYWNDDIDLSEYELWSNGIIESTPKSLLTPKSPKGDFKGTLIFSDFPSGIKGKKSLENIFWTFRGGLNY